jgi:hypothetical protein
MTKEGAAKGTVALSIIAGFLWVFLFLYWHFKILGAITTMINGAAPPKPGSATNRIGYSVPAEPMDEVEDAGCRALPYLVNSLDPDKNPAYLLAAEELLRKLTAPKDPHSPNTQCPDVRLSLQDEPPDRKQKCEEIRTWWLLHGKEFHQGWRIWSNHCAKD